MCIFALQVDLVGSEKLNNSMGFSMFFVGLGCLTGPPLAGECFPSWNFFRWLTCTNPILPNVHKNVHMHCIYIGWDPWHYFPEGIFTRFCVGGNCGRWLTDLLRNIYFLSCIVAHIFITTWTPCSASKCVCLCSPVCIRPLWSMKVETYRGEALVPASGYPGNLCLLSGKCTQRLLGHISSRLWAGQVDPENYSTVFVVGLDHLLVLVS